MPDDGDLLVPCSAARQSEKCWDLPADRHNNVHSQEPYEQMKKFCDRCGSQQYNTKHMRLWCPQLALEIHIKWAFPGIVRRWICSGRPYGPPEFQIGSDHNLDTGPLGVGCWIPSNSSSNKPTTGTKQFFPHPRPPIANHRSFHWPSTWLIHINLDKRKSPANQRPKPAELPW